jgi:hypothetical protein
MAGPAATPPPAGGGTIIVPPKGSKKEKTYIWMPDGKGNLVKAEASVIKKSFAKLPTSAQVSLTEYLLGVANRQPTDSARQNLWNDIVDGAVAAFKQGKKQSPWDVLDVMTQNNPGNTGLTSTITQYDRITSDALLSKISKSIGFDPALLSEADKADFLAKVNTEAGASGKSTTRKATTGGYETIITPSLFDPKTFTESFLWAKVNLGDTTTLPSSAIKQVANVKTLIRNYGINNLSSKEINQYSVDIASGTKTLDDLTLELSTKAQKLYPAYAERLASNPKLTMFDIAEPIIGTLSKVWEMDSTQFNLDDPNVMRFLNNDVTGKKPAASIAEVYDFAINHPNREKTRAANLEARDAAVGTARAMGFGV